MLKRGSVDEAMHIGDDSILLYREPSSITTHCDLNLHELLVARHIVILPTKCEIDKVWKSKVVTLHSVSFHAGPLPTIF